MRNGYAGREQQRQQRNMQSQLNISQAMMGGPQGQFDPVPAGMTGAQAKQFRQMSMGATDPVAFNRANSAKFMADRAEKERDADELKDWEKQMRQANLQSAQANALQSMNTASRQGQVGFPGASIQSGLSGGGFGAPAFNKGAQPNSLPRGGVTSNQRSGMFKTNPFF